MVARGATWDPSTSFHTAGTRTGFGAGLPIVKYRVGQQRQRVFPMGNSEADFTLPGWQTKCAGRAAEWGRRPTPPAFKSPALMENR